MAAPIIHNRRRDGRVTFGVSDNQAFFRSALATTDIVTSPICFALNHGIFTGNYDHITMADHTFYLSFGRCIRAGINNQLTAQTAMMGEMFGWMKAPLIPAENPDDPALPGELSLSQEEARNRYRNAVWTLFNSEHHVPAAFRAIRDGWVDRIGDTDDDVDRAGVREYLGTANADLFTPPAAFTFFVAYNLMYRFIPAIPANRRYSNTYVAVHAIISFAKRGVVTDAYIRKIQDALIIELNYTQPLDRDLMANFFTTFGRNLTSDVARSIVDRWSTYIPTTALRLTIVMQQVANTGLTAIITIGRAIQKNPTFPWSRMARLFPDEMAKAQDAFVAINNDIYYGYNPDLELVRSTNFKNLSYWCKEILVRCNGDQAINQYRGWVRNPTYATVMEQLITHYITDQAAIAVAELAEADTQRALALINAVHANPNVVV